MPNDTAEVTVRPVRAGDEPFVVALGERAFAVYSHDARATMRGMLVDESTLTAVAEIEGMRVGFVILGITRLGRAFGPWSRPAVGRVEAIAVHPDRQRRGVATRLLEWAESQGRACGACVLSLNTATTNHAARRLFTEFGFATLARAGRIYAGGRSAVAMSKPLLDE
jgi:ribosomal protein S18 acetylase RimI-like enzyme